MFLTILSVKHINDPSTLTICIKNLRNQNMSTSGWIVWHQDGALHCKRTSNYWMDPGRSGQISKGKSWETFDECGTHQKNARIFFKNKNNLDMFWPLLQRIYDRGMFFLLGIDYTFH